MFKEYENDIVANMIKKKYAVRGGLVDGSISRTNKGSNTTMLIILVDAGTNKTPKAEIILNDLKDALKESKALYYDVIVHEQCDAAYSMSNIVLPENPEQPSKPAME